MCGWVGRGDNKAKLTSMVNLYDYIAGAGRVLMLGLSAENHMHRSENPSVSTFRQIIGSDEQHFVDINCALGGNPKPGENSDQDMVAPAGQGVAPLNPVDNLDVFRVFGALGGMAGGFNRVRPVEAVVREGHLEEITAHHFALGLQPGFLVVKSRPIYLILVDGDADHVGPGMGRNCAHRAAHAAARVQNAGSGLHTQQIHRHLLVDSSGIAVGFPRNGRGKVEGLAPPPLINIGHQIVERVHESRDLISGLDLFRAAEE
nr:hypothetical protein SETIT_9G548600v2 [Ipomoea batatas]